MKFLCLDIHNKISYFHIQHNTRNMPTLVDADEHDHAIWDLDSEDEKKEEEKTRKMSKMDKKMEQEKEDIHTNTPLKKEGFVACHKKLTCCDGGNTNSGSSASTSDSTCSCTNSGGSASSRCINTTNDPILNDVQIFLHTEANKMKAAQADDFIPGPEPNIHALTIPFSVRGQDEIWGGAVFDEKGTELISEEAVRLPLLKIARVEISEEANRLPLLKIGTDVNPRVGSKLTKPHTITDVTELPFRCIRCWGKVQKGKISDHCCANTVQWDDYVLPANWGDRASDVQYSPKHLSKRGETTRNQELRGSGGYLHQGIPKANKNGSKRKGRRKKPVTPKHLFANSKKASLVEGGSVEVFTSICHNLNASGLRLNNRTCLGDSICALLHAELKTPFSSRFFSLMPPEGDSSVSLANSVLAFYRMRLYRASANYNRTGGYPYHILNDCRHKLVINIRLGQSSRSDIYASHFIAWDGPRKTLWDTPNNFIAVNQNSDTASAEDSKAVFETLYQKPKFTWWQITQVYKLDRIA